MINQSKVNLIFAARLTKEKGFDLVIDFCDAVKGSKWEEKIMIHIFGDGILMTQIPNHPRVTYHGQQPKEILMETWKECDYGLMPSRFLETFGLSALDSLTVGVPVIGFVKGGLGQFRDGMIEIKEEKDFVPGVFEALGNINTAEYDSLSKNCKDIAGRYTWDIWRTRFEEIVGVKIKGSKILMVSDYSGKIGGIESYIYQVLDKLKSRDASSTGFMAAGIGKTLTDKFFTFINVFNKKSLGKRVNKYIKNNQPDLIWRHSIQRAIGFGAFAKNVDISGPKQVLMIHDFGIIFPFPSLLHSEDQLLTSFTFSERKEAGFQSFGGGLLKKFLRFIPLWFKFRSSKKMIKKIHSSIDVVLVPSEFMKIIFEKYFPGKIEVLSHAL